MTSKRPSRSSGFATEHEPDHREPRPDGGEHREDRLVREAGRQDRTAPGAVVHEHADRLELLDAVDDRLHPSGQRGGRLALDVGHLFSLVSADRLAGAVDTRTRRGRNPHGAARSRSGSRRRRRPGAHHAGAASGARRAEARGRCRRREGRGRTRRAAAAAELQERAARADGAGREVIEAAIQMAQDPMLADDVSARIDAGTTGERAVFEAFRVVRGPAGRTRRPWRTRCRPRRRVAADHRAAPQPFRAFPSPTSRSCCSRATSRPPTRRCST